MNDALHLAIVIALFVVAAEASRRRDRPGRPVGVLWAFWPNVARSLTGRNASFLALAVLATAALVLLGWDRALQDVWQRADPLDRDVLWALLIGGNFWTLVVALVVLALARARRSARLRLAGAASLQAVLAAFVVTHALKVLTGRHGPLDPLAPQHAPFPKVDDAADFAFDFWNHTTADGRFFWPSGHTLSSMVLVTALWACFPTRRWIAWVGYPLVLFMGAAMLDGDFHWTSDVVAGLLLGWPLGWTVGARVRAEHARRGSLPYLPS